MLESSVSHGQRYIALQAVQESSRHWLQLQIYLY